MLSHEVYLSKTINTFQVQIYFVKTGIVISYFSFLCDKEWWIEASLQYKCSTWLQLIDCIKLQLHRECDGPRSGEILERIQWRSLLRLSPSVSPQGTLSQQCKLWVSSWPQTNLWGSRCECVFCVWWKAGKHAVSPLQTSFHWGKHCSNCTCTYRETVGGVKREREGLVRHTPSDTLIFN